jgi:hypothetical protein
MDFVSVANSISSVQRYLQERDEDDFTNLDTSRIRSSDSILDMTKEAAALYDPDDSLGNAPMISASAEAELFLLATNFLLCESCICSSLTFLIIYKCWSSVKCLALSYTFGFFRPFQF